MIRLSRFGQVPLISHDFFLLDKFLLIFYHIGRGSVKGLESQVPIGSQCKQAQERKHSGNDEFHYLFTPLSYLYHWKSYA